MKQLNLNQTVKSVDGKTMMFETGERVRDAKGNMIAPTRKEVKLDDVVIGAIGSGINLPAKEMKLRKALSEKVLEKQPFEASDDEFKFIYAVFKQNPFHVTGFFLDMVTELNPDFDCEEYEASLIDQKA